MGESLNRSSSNLGENTSEIQADNILMFKNLSTGYNLSGSKKLYLHKGLNCTVGRGELITLIGPNGAGKSTLLKTLTGMIQALSGDVYYNESNLANISKKEIAKKVAVVLTDKIEDRYLNVFDIVGTGRYPYGSFLGNLTKADKDIIVSALKTVGAYDLVTRYFYSLSDGEKQKVLLARAIAQDTPLILLDEPTAFIDSPGKVIIMNLLNELVVNHHKTILLTTHDTELALRYATKLWLLGKENYFEEGMPEVMAESGQINQLLDREGVMFNRVTKRFEM